MQKMSCLFVRSFPSRHQALATDEVSPGCEWALAGEGIPTRKWDGTAVRFLGGRLYARYDCKAGKTPPAGFEPCQPDGDPVTGHWPGWLEVFDQPQYRWHREALQSGGPLPDGTYELCGPKISANPERLDNHVFIRHGSGEIPSLTDLSFNGIREYLETNVMEGLVFHHPDGRRCKIRRGDFQLPRPVRANAYNNAEPDDNA